MRGDGSARRRRSLRSLARGTVLPRSKRRALRLTNQRHARRELLRSQPRPTTTCLRRGHWPVALLTHPPCSHRQAPKRPCSTHRRAPYRERGVCPTTTSHWCRTRRSRSHRLAMPVRRQSASASLTLGRGRQRLDPRMQGTPDLSRSLPAGSASECQCSIPSSRGGWIPAT